MLRWPEASAICRDGLAARECGRPAAVLPGKAGKGYLGRDALAEKRVGPVSRALGERSCFTGPKPARSAVTVWRRKDAEDRLPYFPEKPEKAAWAGMLWQRSEWGPSAEPLGSGVALLARSQRNLPRWSGGERMRKTNCRTSRKSRKRLPGQGCIGREASDARQMRLWGRSCFAGPQLAQFAETVWRRRDAEAMPAYFSAKPEMVSLVACGRKKF